MKTEFIPISVKAVINLITDTAELRRWMLDAEQEKERTLDNEAEFGRDIRIEMLNSEIRLLQERMFELNQVK